MSIFTRFYSLCNEIETTDRGAKREYLIFNDNSITLNDNFGILFFAMIILSVKIQPVLVQTNAMHMPYILPKTERIRSFDYWTWSRVSIGKKSADFNKGNTVCFHEANQIWKFYIWKLLRLLNWILWCFLQVV